MAHTFYGVMIVSSKTNNNNALSCALIVGGIVAVCGICVRLWWGSPNPALTQLGIRHLIPPVWLMGLLWTLWYFALGAALGAVLCVHGGCSIAAWRGACFFLLMIGVGFLWYPLYFVRQNALLALLVILATLFCAVLCALSWQGIATAAAAVLWLHVLWLLYMLVLQLICIFGV